MKKIGLIAGASFLAGALFFALTFGYLQKSNDGPDQQYLVKEQAQTQPQSQQQAETEKTPLPETTTFSPPTAEADAVKITGLNFAPLVKRVRPAVVKVESESMRSRRGNSFRDLFFNTPRRRERVPGVGSGFLISPDGYIITNNHVVQGALTVNIKTIDDKEFKAKIIGTDPKTDLALLKIKGKDLPYIGLGNSNLVEVGEWVLAIGNPLNQDLTVTAGIISAKGRQLGLAAYEDFLQTDAAINMGNSGGPLINMNGKVIGINSAILAPTGGNVGIGFAIPSNMAKRVIDDLKSKGRVVRGYLGVSIGTVTEKEAPELDYPMAGVIVQKVERDSPAEKAGLKRYDLITRVNGKRTKKSVDLSTRIAEVSPGGSVELEVYRKQEKHKITVTVGEAPESERFKSLQEDSRTFDLGMVLVNNSPSTAKDYDLKTDEGIVVKQVDGNGPAAENNIRRFDVILQVNRVDVHNVKDFREIISRKKPGSLLILYVNRNGDEGVIRFRLPE